jgi:hypothetical protein
MVSNDEYSKTNISSTVNGSKYLQSIFKTSSHIKKVTLTYHRIIGHGSNPLGS